MSKNLPSHVGLANTMKLRNQLVEAYRKGDSKKVLEIQRKLKGK